MISPLLAQNPKPLGNITGIGPLGNTVTSAGPLSTTLLTLEHFISNIIGALTIVAALWFLYQVIMSAITWISSNGDKQNLQNAQKRLINSFLGLLVAVSGYVLTALLGRFLGIPDIFEVALSIVNLHP